MAVMIKMVLMFSVVGGDAKAKEKAKIKAGREVLKGEEKAVGAEVQVPHQTLIYVGPHLPANLIVLLALTG